MESEQRPPFVPGQPGPGPGGAPSDPVDGASRGPVAPGVPGLAPGLGGPGVPDTTASRPLGRDMSGRGDRQPRPADAPAGPGDERVVAECLRSLAMLTDAGSVATVLRAAGVRARAVGVDRKVFQGVMAGDGVR